MPAFTSFQPSGNTYLIAASSSTSGGGVQVATGSQQAMYVANPSTSPVYVAAGSSTIQAACPTTAVPCAGLCIPNGGARVITTPPQGYLSAVTSAGSASIFATPGAFGN